VKRSSSPSDADPFAFLVACGPVAALTTRQAWVQTLLEVEAALVGAQADAGVAPLAAAGAIARACDVGRYDVDAIVAEAGLGGNLVIPLLPRVREIVGPEHAALVHRDATSQDVMDAAAALVVRRCADAAADGLAAARRDVAGLADRHGGAPMIARTLGRHAVPTTFATVTDRWRDGLDEAVTALATTRRGPVWLGGPAGDGTSYGPQHEAVLAAFGARLDLDVAAGPRHAQRATTARAAGAWGVAAAAVAKVALDVVLLAQDDVAELSEEAPGAGGSSSMPHKRNPVAAIAARAAAMQVPGLVATLLHAAGGGEWERAAGAWHAEWPALQALLRATGSSAEWLRRSLARVVVHPERMAANLARRAEP
jgi:3-carboxy-cis,cis-muconate cycloisomerase